MDESAKIPERKARKVRPYLLTGGRTTAELDLPLETMVMATPKGSQTIAHQQRKYRQILELATETLSIAEVSAHLSVPLQTAKILVADLVQSDDLTSHSLQTSSADNRPDLQLLERVLDGLQNL